MNGFEYDNQVIQKIIAHNLRALTEQLSDLNDTLKEIRDVLKSKT